MANDLFSVEGKVAVVTGGSRGIGLMIASGLVDAGVRVYVSSRKAEVCEQVAKELSKKGECISVPADLGTDEGIEKLRQEVASRESALHLLVNNAGATWGAPIDEFPAEAFDKVMNLNVRAQLTQAFLPQLRAAATPDAHASVVNIGSVDGLRTPAAESYAYSTSKAGVHMLTQHLAKRLAREMITVNAIAPGPFDSKMMAFLLDDPKGREQMESAVPLGRIGRPDDNGGDGDLLRLAGGAPTRRA